MLTPAYAVTATERVLPRLALDFTTASLDPRVTVARALNTATRVNASGLIETVNAGLPRFDFDPVTLACRGLLIEETRENLCAYSAAVGGTGWTLDAGVTVSGTTTAPDGSSANTISCTNAVSGVYKQISSLGAATYTVSFYVKAGTSTSITVGLVNIGYLVGVNLTTGAITGGTGAGRAVVANAGNGWWRVSVYNVCNAGNFGPLIVSNTANTTFSVWGAQFEIGAFATSYIPTTTTSLTRNADVVSMTGTNFSDWYNAAEGTFRAIGANFGVSATAGYSPFFVASDGTNNNRIRVSRSTGTSSTLIRANIVAATVSQFNLDAFLALNTLGNVVLSYKSTGAAYALNGGTPATNGAFTVPTVNKLNIGIDDSGLAVFNGWVQKISYWPQQLTTAEVQAFSK